jgi:hypothetical protein
VFEIERRGLRRMVWMRVIEADDFEASVGRVAFGPAVLIGTHEEAPAPFEICRVVE